MIAGELRNLIGKSLKNLGLTSGEIHLEHPEDISHGDYSTNIAMAQAKIAGVNPKELAEKIILQLRSDLKNSERSDLAGFIEKIEVAGPGFINFFLSPEFFNDSIKEIRKEKEDFGRNKTGGGEKVLMEYSSPNIAKPFSIGHLRSTVIGDAVANILEFSGHKVIRDNHLGDWGTQFGKLIVAIKKWGDFEALGSDPEPIKTLVNLYVKFHDEAQIDPSLEDQGRAWFAKLENKDKEAIAIWKKCIELSLKEFKKIYGRLQVHEFDTAYGESFFEDKMKDVIRDVKEKELGKESEGAFIIEFDEYKKLPPLLLIKSDGSSLYALRDLTADRWRKKEYGDDIKIINEVGSEQSQYFRQIFEAEDMLGYFKKDQRVHIAHGLYRFKEGKMSTRKGNVVWLEDILNEAVKRAGEINQETAEAVAIGALKFNDLKRESIKDIVFDWEEILNIKGDSGPYLQYAYARSQSILKKAKQEGVKPRSDGVDAETRKALTSTADTQKSLERLLYRFPEVVERSAQEYAPHYITTYLIDLARTFSTFYAQEKIVDPADPSSPYKVALTEAFSIVLKNGLNLLGIQVPEKM